MNFLLILLCTVAAVFVLREPIRRAPWAFYLLAVALDVLLFASGSVQLPRPASQALVMLMARGGLGTALFVVVMYIGVLPRKSRVSRWLRPIRAELSIMACLLVAGHMVRYLMSYVPRIADGQHVAGNVAGAIAVGVVMLALIVVLGVTSARFVKRRMNVRSWRRLQRWAYPFYALIFVHVACMLGPSAVRGGTTAIVNLAVYTVILVGYMVLRAARAKADARDRVDIDETLKAQGFVEATASEQ